MRWDQIRLAQASTTLDCKHMRNLTPSRNTFSVRASLLSVQQNRPKQSQTICVAPKPYEKLYSKLQYKTPKQSQTTETLGETVIYIAISRPYSSPKQSVFALKPYEKLYYKYVYIYTYDHRNLTLQNRHNPLAAYMSHH